jgi:hypothetical protein
VASALLRKGDYKGAMKYAKLAGAGGIYNKAFEGRRREFLREHFASTAAVLVLSAAALTLSGKYRKKRRAEKAAAEKNEEKEAEQL